MEDAAAQEHHNLKGTPLPLDLPTVAYETKILEHLRLGATSRISRQLLHDAEAGMVIDFATRDMLARIETLIWADPDQEHHKTVRVFERPYFESWRHQYFYGLKRGGGFQRFLSKLWDIPLDYEPERKSHVIDVHVPAVLPENEMVLPEGMGRFHYPITVRHT